ncbi:MAG: hypothetical protein AVDCRST_MAG04-3537 [uncultured Acetobacteraceae bacterium]|uniref:Uncharacterized protein n=1 Tax=uncultured Acetobacteraceae bacterium TaxID=169975 RepID=A0A6J4JJ32_9PROT|nr:MAG: hypothetical protein AVDCRST_MAG04-3537 [uncultured Acetobacteraceae bacterium]
METRHRRRAALPDGRAAGDRGGHRRRCAEPHARPRTPGVRPHRVTRTMGKVRCAQTADPCNKVGAPQAGQSEAARPRRPGRHRKGALDRRGRQGRLATRQLMTPGPSGAPSS